MRGPGSLRPVAGDEYRPRRLDGHAARQHAARGAVASRIDDHDGRLLAAVAHHPRNDLRLGRRRRPGGALARRFAPHHPHHRSDGLEGDVIITQEFSSTTSSARTPTAISSAGTARPASAVRNSGSVRATTARRRGSPPRSMRRKPPTMRLEPDARKQSMEYLRSVLSGGGRDRRRRVGIRLSDPVRREEGGAAHGERGALRAMAARPTRAAAAKSRREQVEGTLKEIERAAQKGQAAAALGAAHAGRARLVEAPLHGDRGRARRRRLRRHDRAGRGAVAGARLRLRGRLRPAVLDAVVSQEAARSEIPQRISRTPSTSSFAASRPACRCSTASS